MKKFILIILSVFLSFSALAISEAQMQKEFKRFYSEGPLSSRHCGRNINNFIIYLKQQGYAIDKIDTVNITGERTRWSLGRVMALNSRFGSEVEGHRLENWYFHVVAIFKGKVYDFSFDQAPLVLNLADYLEKMFIPHQAFMPWGATFRIGGEGPYYTAEHARAELAQMRFKISHNDGKGNLTVIQADVETQTMLEIYKSH